MQLIIFNYRYDNYENNKKKKKIIFFKETTNIYIAVKEK